MSIHGLIHAGASNTSNLTYQKKCASKFRDICGVAHNQTWPQNCTEERTNEVTGEIYYTPDFKSDVRHATNTEIFDKVAEDVLEDIKVSQDSYPTRLVSILTNGE